MEDVDRAESLNGSIQSIDRCGQVLRLVAREGSVRAATVAAELGLQRSTAHRYLASMEEASILKRDRDGGYRAGPLLAQMGVLALRRSRVVDEASHYMDTLAADCQQTVVLTIWGGRGPVVARVQEADDRFVHVSVREGAQLSIDSSHGYLFAAHLWDTSSMRRVLAEATPPERRAVESNVESVRELGFAEHSMAVRGIRAIATPIFHADGTIAAVIAIVGTTEGIPTGADSGFAAAIKDAARNISTQLGYEPQSAVGHASPAALRVVE